MNYTQVQNFDNPECPLGWQVIVRSTLGNFIRVRPVLCIEGVYWACLLSLPGRAVTVQASWRLHGSYLWWKFFVLQDISVCSSVLPKLNRQDHCVFLCLLGIMRVIVWTMRMKEFHEEDSLSPQTLVAYYKRQIKDKIWSEWKWLSLLELGARWLTVARLCCVIGASLIFRLDISRISEFVVIWRKWPPCPVRVIDLFVSFCLTCLI